MPALRQWFNWCAPQKPCHPERSLTLREANRRTKSKDPVSAGATTRNERDPDVAAGGIFVLMIFLLLPIASFGQAARSFPGEKSELTSPDQRWTLQNVDRDEEPYHTILLKDNTSGKIRRIYDYDRSVRVVWAPDSCHFAINEYAGSDFTETSILSVDETIRKIDVQKEVLHHDKQLRERVTAVGRGHDYFAVMRWLDKHRAVVHHWGHNDVPPLRPFCECYIYDLNSSVESCARQEKEEDELCDAVTP
jgi:hypothetical protein